MDEGTAALLGVVVGWLLPTIATLVRGYTTGRRFENAIRAELAEAKELINRKMIWILRDESGFTPHPSRDPAHVLVRYGRLLYLGEPEGFSVNMPFWEQNVKTIVEVSSPKGFAELFGDVVLVNKYVSKFRDMKLAFTSGLGDPKAMAIACLADLISIHDKLVPNRAIGPTLLAPDAPANPAAEARSK